MTPFDEFLSNIRKQEEEQIKKTEELQNNQRQAAELQSEQSKAIFKNVLVPVMKSLKESAEKNGYNFKEQTANATFTLKKYTITISRVPVDIEFRYVGGLNIECELASSLKNFSNVAKYNYPVNSPPSIDEVTKNIEDGIKKVLNTK